MKHNVYADFNFYKDEYHGSKIPPEQFPAAAHEASAYIDYATMGKLQAMDEIPDAARIACCAIADAVYEAEKQSSAYISANGPALKSETVGPHSVTYAGPSEYATVKEQLNAEKFRLCRMYLWQYMYRGVPTL